ncbi:MAG: iron-containing alcohol dehydrogenase [Candidatus Omnitrophica bacterium]|nr:iron-containing alcohol dehydrogenase [Candidatus Omnitrophota bacterium]MCM8802901.1 iron-containing alcohol dehydrogenase [Candidatus Omnitrophota bacterium]
MRKTIKDLLGKSFKCKFCGRIHKIEIEKIKDGKIEKIEKFISKILKGKKLLILCDDITWEVAGRYIKEQIKNNIPITLILKPKNEKRVTARYEYIDEIEKNIQDVSLIITVGAGTITDLGKLTGNKYKIPVFSFPTAPSMNGYTSPVAAFIKEGVKLTIPVNPPKSIYIDREILSKAPLELIKAGFADSLAKSFANADWKISSIITSEKFCSLPLKIVSKAEKKYINKSNLILKRDKKIIKNLMDGLNLGGISMIIAGSSSPASGGEHLISHFLDMYACQNNRELFSYHGLQVGTGIYISSLIYERLKHLNDFEIKKMLNKRNIDYDEKERILISLFPSSKNLLKDIFKKKNDNLKKMRIKLFEEWENIKKTAFSIVYNPVEIKNFLSKVNCPVYLNEIVPEKNLIYKTFLLSRFIREKITILDIADEIGILEEIANEYIKGNI